VYVVIELAYMRRYTYRYRLDIKTDIHTDINRKGILKVESLESM